MKISAVQLRPEAGDIESNLAKHLELVELAATQGADVVFFPELSLTGYEPQLAQSLAFSADDRRLDGLQFCSDRHHLIIGIGLPLSAGAPVQIGMVWFTPHGPRQTYAKQQLHSDELPFFGPGHQQLVLTTPTHTLAPAICYESLQPDHAKHAAHLGADVYLASVAKSASGIAKAVQHYPAIAQRHNLYVLMANGVGPCDNFVSVGQSAIWNPQGELLTSLDSETEGIVMLDTVSHQASVQVAGT